MTKINKGVRNLYLAAASALDGEDCYGIRELILHREIIDLFLFGIDNGDSLEDEDMRYIFEAMRVIVKDCNGETK